MRRARERAARAHRFERRRQLRPITSLARVRRCGDLSVSGGGVTVGVAYNRDGTSHAGYGGIGTCGSVWSCPQCAAKVATRRADELANVMRAVDALGGSGFMLTLTMRHTAGDRLGWTREQRRQVAALEERTRTRALARSHGDEIDPAAEDADDRAMGELLAARGCWDALADGWGRVTSGKQWSADQDRHGGLLGWCKVVEVTHGANGWHCHVHVLLCYGADVSVFEVHPAAERMFRRWQRALQRAGFDASGDAGPDGRIPGWDLRRAQLGDGDLADYFTKIAHEVTGSHRKEGRRPGGRTPMQLLVDAVETYEESAVARWWEWEAASDGRRQLTWSGGRRSLRALAGLAAEATDEEIAAEELPADERIGLAPECWGWVRAGQRESEVLDVAETDGMDGLRRWLDVHGQDYVTGAGLDWTEQPATPPDRPVPRDRGRGVGYLDSTPAVLRPRDPAGRPLRRPSDRPPRWTADARAVLRTPSRPDVSDQLTIFNDAADT